MKKVASFLLIIMILSSALALSGCYIYFGPTWRSWNPSFEVIIKDVSQQEVIDFEVARTYDLKIRLIGDVEVNDDTYKDIKIEYNEENTAVSYRYDEPRNNIVNFSIYLHDLGADNTLKITYAGKTVEVGYKVVDYDFDSAGWITPTCIDDLNAFPEFKEMLLSIKHHEFKEPYKGLDSYSYSSYWGDVHWYYNLADKNDTGYLEYLTDSVYYPSTFDLVEQNPIASREAYMCFNGREKVQAGAPRSVMDTFSVSYGIIDPCCTHPQYPLHSMSFYARNKELRNSEDYPLSIDILLEKYPERFFEYDLNGLKIYIRVIGNTSVQAYFTDEHYFYSLSASYDYDN